MLVNKLCANLCVPFLGWDKDIGLLLRCSMSMRVEWISSGVVSLSTLALSLEKASLYFDWNEEGKMSEMKGSLSSSLPCRESLTFVNLKKWQGLCLQYKAVATYGHGLT